MFRRISLKAVNLAMYRIQGIDFGRAQLVSYDDHEINIAVQIKTAGRQRSDKVRPDELLPNSVPYATNEPLQHGIQIRIDFVPNSVHDKCYCEYLRSL